MAEIDGEVTRVYVGSIDKVREASFRLGDVKNDPEVDREVRDEWQGFVDQATLSIKAWVREKDGLIARFVMSSEHVTVKGITQKKQIDYTFSPSTTSPLQALPYLPPSKI